MRPVLIVTWLLLLFFLSHKSNAAIPFTLGSDPLDKAVEAGYIQTGASHLVDGTQNYLNDTYAKPYYLDKIVAPYMVYKKKELTIKLGQDRLKLQTDRATLSIPF